MPSMPSVQASKARIFIDEFELTQQSSGAQLVANVTTLDYSIMGEPAKQFMASIPNFTIPHSGYYTGHGATGGLGYFEAELFARLGSNTPVIVTLVLDTVSYTLQGTWNSQLTIDAPVDGLITVEGNWSSPDSVSRGSFLASQDFVDLGESTPVDLGTPKYTQMLVHASGFPDLTAGAESVTVKLSTSATVGGTYVTWLTAVIKKPGAVIVSGAQNPNRWVKAIVDTTAGVVTPVSFAVAALA